MRPAGDEPAGTVDELESSLSLLRSQERQVDEATKDLEVKAGMIEFLEREIEAKETAIRSQASLKEVKDTLDAVRSRFHYSGAPQLVVSSRVDLLSDRINYYLSLLNTNYKIRLKDGLDFECIFPNKIIDSSELSGGEKVDLSLSFRLASCESFCSRVGFMIFDEPTAWLDSDTVHEMTSVIDRLREIGDENNYQFLIVTHSQPLIPCFDQIIQLHHGI
jgi:DNA repair exonuclease SbcCD ATPase subunit